MATALMNFVHFSVCIIFLYYMYFFKLEANTLIRPFCQTQCSCEVFLYRLLQMMWAHVLE